MNVNIRCWRRRSRTALFEDDAIVVSSSWERELTSFLGQNFWAEVKRFPEIEEIEL